MGYLKIVSYLYLVVAAFFFFDGIVRLQDGKTYFISFLFAGAAIFMFFFRMRFARKFDNRKKDK